MEQDRRLLDFAVKQYGLGNLTEYDFACDPRRASGPVTAEPLFLGVFDWNDAEDEEA